MNTRIGLYIYETIGFVPIDFTPEAYRHFQQVRKDNIEKEKSLAKNVENTSCTDGK